MRRSRLSNCFAGKVVDARARKNDHQKQDMKYTTTTQPKTTKISTTRMMMALRGPSSTRWCCCWRWLVILLLRQFLNTCGGSSSNLDDVVGLDDVGLNDVTYNNLFPWDNHHHHLLEINGVEIDPRIIGGVNATQGRFPYYVNLEYNGIPTCGAVLIAPDIVLTAAHCWQGPSASYLIEVGRYNEDDPNDEYELFNATQYIPHPLYGVTAQFDRDFMILVLNGTTSKTPIALNFNQSVPFTNQSLTVIGLGSINPDEIVLPPILQQVNVNVVSNAICEQAQDANSTFQGFVTDNMLCAAAAGRDACNGDSGGPLIVAGDTAADDVLVGLVSWGEGCANPPFPGVYARVSALTDWIQAIVCRHSENPPSSFDCSQTFSPAPTPLATTLPSPPTVPISITINVPFIPTVVWWFILNERDQVVFIVPRYFYTSDQNLIQQQLSLPIGQTYTFVMKSENGHGINAGNYVVRLGRLSQRGPVLLQIPGDSFEYEQRNNFTLSTALTGAPTTAPSLSLVPTSSMAPTPPNQVITLTIVAIYPPDVAYFVLNAVGQAIVNETFGTFSTSPIQEELLIPSGHSYTFVIQSEAGFGLNGNYSASLGAPGDGGPLLFQSQGNYTFEERTPFYVPRSFTAVPSVMPSDPPTLVPTITAQPTLPIQVITLIINFNFFPSDIGYTITNIDSNKTVVNVPFDTFNDGDVKATEMYLVFSDQEYSITVRNLNSDGLYPGNYTVLLGPPDGGGPVLLFSDGQFRFEETRSFFVPAITIAPLTSLAPTVAPVVVPTLPSVSPVRVIPSARPSTHRPSRSRPSKKKKNIMSPKAMKSKAPKAPVVVGKNNKAGRKAKGVHEAKAKASKRHKGQSDDGIRKAKRHGNNNHNKR